MSNIPLNILGFLCYCCFLPQILHKRHERQIRAGNRRHRAGKPRDLHLHRRQRHISVLSLGNSKASQPLCRLLTDLPAEIRSMIWLECLGGLKFHLIIRDQRVQQRECLSPRSELCWEPNRCARSRPSNELVPVRNFLSLLISCRQIYVEGIPILYSRNEFITLNPDIIEFSPRLFVSQRIRTIRSLRFGWVVKGAAPILKKGRFSSEGDRLRTKIWTTTWKNLSEMDGLEELRVYLGFVGQTWYDLSAPQLTSLFEPALAIKTPKLFELNLPMQEQPDLSPWAGLPFQIRWSTPTPT